jgi:FkbM family methyltransferase
MGVSSREEPRTVEIQTMYNYPLHFPEGDVMVRHVTNKGYYEHDLLEALRETTGPLADGAWVDVGAYVGTHSSFFLDQTPAREVFAYEPTLLSYRLLERNIKTLRKVSKTAASKRFVAHCRAVSDRKGWASISSYKSTNIGGTRWSSDRRSGDQRPVVTLDSHLPRQLRQPLSVLKVDAEDNDQRVLEGASQLISTYRPVIAFEALEGQYAHDILNFLSQWDYRVVWDKKEIKYIVRPGETKDA